MTTAHEQRRRATLSGLARMLADAAASGHSLQDVAALARLVQDEFFALVDDVAGADPEPETQEAPEAPKPAPTLSPAPAAPPPEAKPARKPRAQRSRRAAAPVAPIMPPPPPAPAAYAMLGG